MTHEEIQDAIEQLRELEEKKAYFAQDAMRALIGRDFPDLHDSIGTLIELLEQADPYSHIELPLDADGVPVHIGDEVYARYDTGYYLNGKVENIVYTNDTASVWIKDVKDEDEFPTSSIHHGRHIPTARQILEDCVNEAFNLGADTERNSEGLITKTYNEKRAMAKAYAMKLAPLLSDEAETGYED